MKQFISNIYHNTKLGFAVIQPFKNVYEYLRYALISDETVIKREFIANFGYAPNLENPQTFNEKLQWLKLHDRTPLHTICADKYKVRDYVKEKIGEEYLIPLVLETKNVRDIVPENLPDYPFIIKTNHDSSGGIIVRDKSQHNWINVQNTLSKFLNINYYYRYKEWQYKNIERRVVVEELLMDKNGEIPLDYKLHCFHGKVEVIQVDIDRYTNHKRNLYDQDWNLLPFTWSSWSDGKPLWDAGRDLEKPKNLNEMLTIAGKLSKPFCYSRIDVYNFDDTLYFGEVTFHHGSGLETIHPKKYDLELGELIDFNTLKA